MKRRLSVAVLAAALACIGLAPAWAQQPAIQVQRTYSWIALPGTASDIAITAGGDVFAVDPQQNVWRWQTEGRYWSPQPGKFVRITVGAGGRPWAVSADGKIYRYNGIGWDQAPGENAADIAGNFRGAMFIARPDGSIARWNPQANEWQAFAGADGVYRLAVGPDGAPWAIRRDNTVRRHDAARGVWVDEGRARDLAFGPDGTLFVVTADGMLQTRVGTQGQLTQVPNVTNLAGVAVGPGDKPWVFTEDGRIAASDTFAPVTQPQVVRRSTGAQPGAKGKGTAKGRNLRPAPPPAELPSPDPIVFFDTLATASQLAIGEDGSIFALIGTQIGQWSNTFRRFEPFPGALSRITVDLEGHPWGINSLGRIFRHDGSDWQQVRPGTATGLALDRERTLFIADSNRQIRRRQGTQYITLPMTGARDAVLFAMNPQGRPWLIKTDNTIHRCDVDPCQRLPRLGKSIAIGPAGSVFVASTDNKLLRWNFTANDWEEIQVPGHDAAWVAVGPRDRPWIITSAGKVLASALFDRDESQDRLTAIATTNGTVGTGDTTTVSGVATASAFEFKRNLTVEKFETIQAGVVCNTNDDVSVGVDGTVIVLCDGGSAVNKFNTKTELFATYAPNPGSILAGVTDSAGRLWAVSSQIVGRVLHQKTSSTQSSYRTFNLPVSNAGTACGVCSAGGVAVSTDDIVYVIFNNVLFRKLPSENNFKKFSTVSVSSVAVGAPGDLWIVDTDHNLRQWNGSKFVIQFEAGTIQLNQVAGGSDGSIWTGDLSFPAVLRRWNATNQKLDATNQSANLVGVGPDGRPWFMNNSVDDLLYKAR